MSTHTFGGPLTIGSRAYVRNTGERAQQVERIKATARFQPFILRGSPKMASTQDDVLRFTMDTKNPSVPVRRGVINNPSGDCSVAAANSSAFSPSAVTVCDGDTTLNSGCLATKARTCSPFSGGSTEQVI